MDISILSVGFFSGVLSMTAGLENGDFALFLS